MKEILTKEKAIKKVPTKKRELALRGQLFLNKEEIAEIEICSISCAEQIMTNMRKWKKKNEKKLYPKEYVLSKDFFDHFWLVAGNKTRK